MFRKQKFSFQADFMNESNVISLASSSVLDGFSLGLLKCITGLHSQRRICNLKCNLNATKEDIIMPITPLTLPSLAAD